MMQPSQPANSIDNIKRFFQYTQDAQRGLERHLNKVLVLAGHIKATENEDVIWRLRNKTLQLRLDQRDILLVLMRLQHNLCAALGLEPKNSEHHNLARLMQILGDENSKHQALSLAYLGKKISETYQRNKKPLPRKLTSKPLLDEDEENELTDEIDNEQLQLDSQENIIACEQELSQIAELNAYFQYSLEQLTVSLQSSYEGQPQCGAIYNYFATLQGPVSRFHMALQSGLAHLDALLERFNFLLSFTMQETLEIQPLLSQTIQILEETYNLVKQPVAIPSLMQELNSVPSKEQLEHERRIQRTMPLFKIT